MLDTIFSSTLAETLSIDHVLIVLAVSVALGFLISFSYMFTHKKESYGKSFVATLVMLPTIISIIIMLVGNSIATAFSLTGAFALIRFRSTLGDTKDIAYIFFSVAVGLACGTGYVAYGAVFAVFLCLVMIFIEKTRFGTQKNDTLTLKVTIPENLNFHGLLDDVLNKYTLSWTLKKVRTVDFGALFEATYHISVPAGADLKKLMDEIRAKNGNLGVSLTMHEYELQPEN